jgi:hypothetical protein
LPDEHTCALLHAVPHAPQLLPSDRMSTHAAPHGVRPERQLHFELEQIWPGWQAVAQLPQFALSDVRSAHPVAHAACGAAHPRLPAPPVEPASGGSGLSEELEVHPAAIATREKRTRPIR